MTLYYKTVRADVVGTTIGSVENIGTITLNEYARRVDAMLFQVVSTATLTTAEATMGKVQVLSDDLDINTMEWNGGINLGGAPSTNMQALCSKPVQVNLLKECSPNNKIDFKYDAIAPEPTSEVAVQCTIAYDDGDLPDDVLEALLRGFPLVTDFGYHASDDEIGDALTEDLDETISIAGKYNHLNRILLDVSPDAVFTADEHFLGYLNLVGAGTTISAILPQEIPLPAINAGAGTPVGSPVQVSPIDLPLWIRKTGQQTIAPNVVLQQVTTGANAVSCSIGAIEA